VREKEKTRYEAQAADLGNAVSSLEGSIANLKAAIPASLAQVKSSARKALLVADMLDVDPTHSRRVAALLQEDPEMNDGEFHSDELIATFERLLKSFKARKSQVDQREGENAADFADLMSKKEDQKTTAKDSKSTADGERETAVENITAQLRASVRPLVGAGLARSFASPVQATAKLYQDLVAKSVKSFEANKAAVSGNLDAEIKDNKMVLFMEGTPDAPKSELSMNVVKMLTEAQAASFLAIDVLQHPAILGYTVSKTSRERTPHLYVDGSFYGDHDGLLAKHNAGELKKALGKEVDGDLPIANY